MVRREIPSFRLLERYGETLVLSNQEKSYFFNYEDGEEVSSIKDYEIQFTESIRALVHNNMDIGEKNSTITFYVGDKEYKFVQYVSSIEDKFRKINNKYYFLADDKVLQLSVK